MILCDAGHVLRANSAAGDALHLTCGVALDTVAFMGEPAWQAHLTRAPATLDALVIGAVRYRVATARVEDLYIHQFEDLSERERETARVRHLQQQVQTGQKMTSVVRLAGSVAHDLNNVLTAIMGLVWVLRQDLEEGHSSLEEVQGIADALERGRGLTRELLEHVREFKLYKQRYQIEDVVERVRGLLRVVQSPDVTVEIELADDLPTLEGDAVAIGHALMNVCRNALDALDGKGSLAIRVAPSTGEQPRVVIEVEDSGPGMDAHTRECATIPFFTTRGGEGQGLTKVEEVVHSHGGALSLESSPGQGTTVRIELPVRR